MAIFELFSKRQKELKGEVPEVYIFDDLPNPFIVQVIHILRDVVWVGISNCASIKSI